MLTRCALVTKTNSVIVTSNPENSKKNTQISWYRSSSSSNSSVQIILLYYISLCLPHSNCSRGDGDALWTSYPTNQDQNQTNIWKLGVFGPTFVGYWGGMGVVRGVGPWHAHKHDFDSVLHKYMTQGGFNSTWWW